MNYGFCVRDPSPLSGPEGLRDFDRPTGHRNTTIRITAFHALYLLLDTTGAFERKKLKIFIVSAETSEKACGRRLFTHLWRSCGSFPKLFLYAIFFKAYRKVSVMTSTTSTKYRKSLIPSLFPTSLIGTMDECAGLSFHFQSMKMLYLSGFSLKGAGRGRSFP